jgi:hypothetical protein
LEVSFGVAAYFLSARLRTHQRVTGLALVTVTFASISTVANIAYFVAHAAQAAEVGIWTLVQAVALGVAAPVVALANAALSGELAGLADQRHEEAQERDLALAQMAHEEELSRLATQRAQAEAAVARAQARQAKSALALVQADRPAVPGPAVVTGSGRDEGLQETILAALRTGWTSQRDLARTTGRSKTTIQRIMVQMAGDGLLERTASGQYVVAGSNGHGHGLG